MSLVVDPNDGLFYQPLATAPKDGTPVHLVYRDSNGLFASPFPFRWKGDRWWSLKSGLPATPGPAKLVGWRTADAFADAR